MPKLRPDIIREERWKELHRGISRCNSFVEEPAYETDYDLLDQLIDDLNGSGESVFDLLPAIPETIKQKIKILIYEKKAITWAGISKQISEALLDRNKDERKFKINPVERQALIALSRAIPMKNLELERDL